jgi:hypothetical protein
MLSAMALRIGSVSFEADREEIAKPLYAVAIKAMYITRDNMVLECGYSLWYSSNSISIFGSVIKLLACGFTCNKQING